jgi:hypothetical protein
MSETGIFVIGVMTFLLLTAGLAFTIYEVHWMGEHPHTHTKPH